jgi:hypothetical protein
MCCRSSVPSENTPCSRTWPPKSVIVTSSAPSDGMAGAPVWSITQWSGLAHGHSGTAQGSAQETSTGVQHSVATYAAARHGSRLLAVPRDHQSPIGGPGWFSRRPQCPAALRGSGERRRVRAPSPDSSSRCHHCWLLAAPGAGPGHIRTGAHQRASQGPPGALAGPGPERHRPRGRCRHHSGCHAAHPRTTATTHSSPNPTTQHVHTTHTIYTSPHTPTHSCLQTYTSLPMPSTSLAPCHIRIQNIPRASHCTAFHCTHHHVTSAQQKNTCGPALPPSQPHPTQLAASWLAPSPTTYSSCINDGTCRKAPAIAAPPSSPMRFSLRLPCTHTHSSHNSFITKPTTRNAHTQRKQSTPHHTLPHTLVPAYQTRP